MIASLHAVSSGAHTSVQWQTLLWVAGAAVVAALAIVLIVVMSRRPKSIEHGIDEFSRSLQAVAPNHRTGGRLVPGRSRPSAGSEDGPGRAMRGEAEAV
jgi:hypothetical protein